MGTRGSFWVGDPRKPDAEWLGCIAWDAHASNFPEMATIDSEEGWRAFVGTLSDRKDFADPKRGGWPFPWADDIFLTDQTYAFIDGRVMGATFYTGLVPVADLSTRAYQCRNDDPAYANIPFPGGGGHDRSQPDSIMIFRSR